MADKYTDETIHRVHDIEEGVYIEVKPCPDFPEQFVTLTTDSDADSKEYFGSVDIALPNEMAIKLGEALIAVAKRNKA